MSPSAKLQSQHDVLVLARVHLRVIAVTSKPSGQTSKIATVSSWYNSRGSILADIARRAAQLKRLVLEGVAVDVADSPV